MLEVARIILFAKDMDAMLAFYEGVLGLQRDEDADDSDDFISLRAGAVSLSLHRIPRRYARNIDIADPPVVREGTPIKVAFRVEDVEAFRARLESRGVRVGKTQKVGSLCFCDGIDPEGNVFQISNRP